MKSNDQKRQPKFPRTAKPAKVFLNLEVLEDRVPVSEQIGTIVALSLLANTRRLFAAPEVRAVSRSSAFYLGDGVAAKVRTHLEVIPPEHIALVRFESKPVQLSANPAPVQRRAWDFQSLPPALFDDLNQDPFALAGFSAPARPAPPRLASGSDGGSRSSVELGGTVGGLPPDSGHALPPATGGLSGNAEDAAQRLNQLALAVPLMSGLPGNAVQTVTGQSSGDAGGNGDINIQDDGHDGHHHHHHKDPVNVLDAHTAIVLDQNVIEHDYSTYAVDLRAQVSGANVQTYSWTYDNSYPGDFTSVSGQTSYNLKFTWASFTGIHPHTITLQTTNVGGGGMTLNFPFKIYGTDSPSYTATQPTLYGNWPTVLPPDALTSEQKTIDSQYYSLGANTGELMVRHSLPTYNPDVPPVTLVYSSTAADLLPIFIDHFGINASRTDIPNTVQAQLTFNSVVGPSTSYNTTLLNPGDLMQVAVQATAAQTKPGGTALATGRYSYSIAVTANYTSAPTQETTTSSGTVSFINSTSGILGNGWSLANVQRLWAIGGGSPGAVVELPGGLSLWFSYNGTVYQSPAGDFSTLVKNGDNTYTRTLKDGTKVNFDTTGRQSALVDRNSNALTFSYDGSGNLLSIKDFNNQLTTFAYSSGRVATITDTASRVTSLGYDGSNRLNSITDPAPGQGFTTPVTRFNYSASLDHLTSLTDPRSNITTFSYDATSGRVMGLTRPDTVSESLTPLQMQGLGSTAVLAAEALATYTDGDDNQWTDRLDWLGFGRPTQEQNPRTDVTAMKVEQRDTNGRVWLSADELARRSRYQYDTLGNPTLIGLPDDNQEQYTYNGFSQPLTYTNARNQVTTYVRDTTTGNLTSLVRPAMPSGAKPTYTYTYNPGGWLHTLKDSNSNIYSFSYDSTRVNLLTRIDEPVADDTSARHVSFGYDAAGNLAYRTNERGKTTSYAYDNLNRLYLVTFPADSGPKPGESFGYDAAGNRTYDTDPLSHTTTTAFDVLNRRISTRDPLSHYTTYAYDNRGNLVSVQDANLNVSTYSYDAANNLVGFTDALSHSWTYGVDAAGQRISASDPLSHITSYAFNQRGWLTGVTDPLSNQVTYGYNATGDRTLITEYDSVQILSYSTAFGFDNLDRKSWMTDPRGKTNTYQYDANGNETQVTGPSSGNPAGGGCGCGCSCCGEGKDQFGNFTFTYDDENQRTSRTDAAGDTYTYTHDPADNCLSVIFPSIATGPSGPLSYGYDAQNRLISVSDSGNGVTLGVTTYAYDLAGRLTSVTDPVANQTQYTYDNANRLQYVTDPRSKYTTYTFDNANRLQSIQDRNLRTRTFGYDNANRLTGETWVGTNESLTYAYDNANRRTNAGDLYSTYTYGYDNANQQTSVDFYNSTFGSHVQLTSGYDGFHNRTSLLDNLSTAGNITYSYDGDHHLTGATWLIGGTQKTQVTLQYDNLNRLATVMHNTPGGVPIATTFGYDSTLQDELLSITHSTTVTLAAYTYTYDAWERIQSYQGPEGTLTYTYDGTNQLTGVTGAHSESYGYDLNGNRTMTGYVTTVGNRLVSDGTYTYSYDDEGNMLTRSAAGDVTTFTWDYRNRMASAARIKNFATSNITFTYDVEDRRIGKRVNGTQTWTVYDGPNPYADFNGSSLAKRYLSGDAVDELFARYDGTNVSWYLTDIQASVRQIANSSGGVVYSVTYDSFGNILNETNPSNGDRFKFTSREWDSEISLYYYRARYYSPFIGHFISEDPSRFGAGDANMYRYVQNNPTNRVDPNGLGAGEDDKIRKEQINAANQAIENAFKEIADLLDEDAGLQQALIGLANEMKKLVSDCTFGGSAHFSIVAGDFDALRLTQSDRRAEIEGSINVIGLNMGVIAGLAPFTDEAEFWMGQLAAYQKKLDGLKIQKTLKDRDDKLASLLQEQLDIVKNRKEPCASDDIFNKTLGRLRNDVNSPAWYKPE